MAAPTHPDRRTAFKLVGVYPEEYQDNVVPIEDYMNTIPNKPGTDVDGISDPRYEAHLYDKYTAINIEKLIQDCPLPFRLTRLYNAKLVDGGLEFAPFDEGTAFRILNLRDTRLLYKGVAYRGLIRYKVVIGDKKRQAFHVSSDDIPECDPRPEGSSIMQHHIPFSERPVITMVLPELNLACENIEDFKLEAVFQDFEERTFDRYKRVPWTLLTEYPVVPFSSLITMNLYLVITDYNEESGPQVYCHDTNITPRMVPLTRRAPH